MSGLRGSALAGLVQTGKLGHGAVHPLPPLPKWSQSQSQPLLSRTEQACLFPGGPCNQTTSSLWQSLIFFQTNGSWFCVCLFSYPPLRDACVCLRRCSECCDISRPDSVPSIFGTINPTKLTLARPYVTMQTCCIADLWQKRKVCSAEILMAF